MTGKEIIEKLEEKQKEFDRLSILHAAINTVLIWIRTWEQEESDKTITK